VKCDNNRQPEIARLTPKQAYFHDRVSVIVEIPWTHFYGTRHDHNTQISVRISILSQSVIVPCISGFVGHTAIIHCRSYRNRIDALYSSIPWSNTPKVALGISILNVVEKIFPVLVAVLPFLIIGIDNYYQSPANSFLSLFLLWSKTLDLPL